MTHLVRISALAVALVGALSAATTTVSPLHFALSKSSPEAGATVEAPAEIRLWFTEEPQEGSTSIRIVGVEEVGVHVTEVAQDSDDPTSFYIELHATLPAGPYTVAWRGMGQDGHVVRDSFDFTVGAD